MSRANIASTTSPSAILAIICRAREGRSLLRPHGEPPSRRRALALRQELLPIFPKGTVPKKYRFVHELPRNAQGKVLASAIKKILLSNLVEPRVENIARTESSWSADFTFDADASYFKGHFPNFAVLPGVVQLGLAQHFAETFLRKSFAISCVKKMKFSRPILPGEKIRFTLEKRADNELGYTYAKGEAICSSGTIQAR